MNELQALYEAGREVVREREAASYDGRLIYQLRSQGLWVLVAEYTRYCPYTDGIIPGVGVALVDEGDDPLELADQVEAFYRYGGADDYDLVLLAPYGHRERCPLLVEMEYLGWPPLSPEEIPF